MIFDYQQPFDSDDSSSDKMPAGFNRLSSSDFASNTKTSDQLDLSKLIKLWHAPAHHEDVSLSLENNLNCDSSAKWELLASALNKEEILEVYENFSDDKEESLAWGQETSTRCEKVVALLSLAVESREQDQVSKSRSYLQQALREFLEFTHTEEQEDFEVQSLMGQIFLEMANQFMETEDLLSAYGFACHTIKLALEIQEDSLYANALATLGVIVGLDGQLDISFQLLSEAADRHREQEDHEGYIIDLMNLGELISRDGMWETSATLLDQAIELARHHEIINLYIKASEIRNQVESILRVQQTDPQRN